MITLGKLSFENFKSFENLYELDFQNSNLFILDGPNGFGKTTIFDAVEICLTGEISRILSTDSKQKSSHLLKNVLNKPTNIVLELVENNETIIVIYASIPKDTTAENNKVSNCILDLKYLKKWPNRIDQIDGSECILDFDLGELLENSQLKNTFNIFNYIQQEETFHFLKNKESDRHKVINYLFGTNDEACDKDKINIIKNKVQEKSDNLQKEKQKIEDINKELEHRLSENLTRENNSIVEPSGKILKFIGNNNVELKANSHIENINSLIWVVNNKSDFEKIKFNYNIGYIVENKKRELENIIRIGHFSKYSDFMKIEKHIAWINKLNIDLEEHKKILKNDNFDFDYLNLLTKVHPKLEGKYSLRLELYKELKNKNGVYQDLLDKIILSRNILKGHYENHKDLNNKVNCPFCGDLKSSYGQLMEEFNVQTKTFEELQDNNQKEIKKLIDELSNSFVLDCKSKSNYFIKKYESYSELLTVLSEQSSYKDQWSSMYKLKSWLDSSNVDLKDFINSSLFYSIGDLLPDKFNTLVLYLKSLIKPVDVSVNYIDIINILKIYDIKEKNNNLFDSTDNLIEISDLEKDSIFLNFIDLKSKSLNFNENKEKIVSLTTKLKFISKKLESLKKISNVYNNQIRRYELNVAKQIAIPFHIYSSKLLQTRPDGNGAYLKVASNVRDAGFIRFISNASDDHDAWNTMSSGQLSGLILSFTLAMNKVYPTKLNTLLIDDPVQTMDEINLASFVQLLRNEFSNYQLVISTHERKTSSYFAYKYQLESIVKTLNLKRERLSY